MKKITSLILAALMLAAMLTVFSVPASAVTKYGSLILHNGSGTAEDPYVITAEYQMKNLAEETNKGTSDFEGVYFALGCSINLAAFTPIGTKDHPFKGNFDGRGNMIQLSINKETTDYVGLFGFAKGAQIKNVVLQQLTRDCVIKGHDHVGSICGYLDKGSIINCTNAIDVSGNSTVGGICGVVSDGTINSCRNFGTIRGDNYAAGIVGGFEEGTLINCSNEGFIELATIYNGGLCGYASGFNMINCINSGTIRVASKHNEAESGGLIAVVEAMSDPIRNCVSAGEYLGDTKLCGSIINFIHDFMGTHNSWCENVFYDNSILDCPVYHRPEDFSRNGIKSRTTEQMKSDEMLATLNQYVSDHPELGLLSWKKNEATGYPCLDYSAANTDAQQDLFSAEGSAISDGSLTVIVGIAAAVVFGLGGFILGTKKKKKPALAGAAESDE